MQAEAARQAGMLIVVRACAYAAVSKVQTPQIVSFVFICTSPHGPRHLELLYYGQKERMELFETSNFDKRSLVLPAAFYSG